MSDTTWDELPIEEERNWPKFSQERLRVQNARAKDNARSNPEEKQRIKIWMAGCMLCVAAFVDILDLLLGIVVIGDVGGDSILSVGADFAFATWFWMLGVDFTSKNALQKWGVMGGQAIGEAIPGIQILPLLTIAIWWTIRITRKEDALKKDN